MPPSALDYDAIARKFGGVPLDYDALAKKYGGERADSKPKHHTSDDVEELRASAERQAPKLGDAVADAAKSVPGAKVEAVRDSKDSDRIADKAERQGVQPSQIADIAAAKISVPHQEAADKVLENLQAQMPVESKEGTVTGEPGKNAVRQTQAIVDTNAPAAEPVKKAELIIQTPEMNKATEASHDDYRKSQELRAAGKDAEAGQLESKIAGKHEAAEKAAQSRTDETPKYKFGNTQANISASSEAGKSLDAARAKIADADLAGDGKDQGSGGNHVTVRYGIQGDDTEGIKKFLAQQKPFEAILGKTESFPPSDHSDGAAVIIAPVNAKDLHRLNAELEKHGDFTEPSFKDYKPHATIAYVKPEKAADYTGMDVTDGKKFTVDSVAISKKDGSQEVVKLGGEDANARQAAGKAPIPLDFNSLKSKLPELQAKLSTSVRAPQPPSEGLKGQRVEVKDAQTGDWKPGEVHADITRSGPTTRPDPETRGDSNLRKLRGVYDDGTKFDNVDPQNVRPVSAKKNPDVGVDFDGTLATETHSDELGTPLPERIASVQKMLDEGKTVEIITRRVEDRPAEVKRIQDWLEKNGLPRLPVTDVKSADILFDDHAHHAPSNANTPLSKSNNARKK